MVDIEKIIELINQPSLSDEDVFKIIETLIFYLDANETQALQLAKCLDQLDALNRRLEFYRQVTIKKI